MSKAKILAALTDLFNAFSTKIDAIFVRKEEGKGLSSNDYTDEDKNSLSSFVAHTGDAGVHITETERTEWADGNNKKHEHHNKTILDNSTASYTIAEQEKLSGIATGAEVNQNTFGAFVVGDFMLAADDKEDVLTLVAGENISFMPDEENKTLTISAYIGNVVSDEATDADIDTIISGSYIGDDEDSYEDIDAIIAGTYS